VRGECARLAGVRYFRIDEFIGAPVDLGRHRLEYRDALRQRQTPPRSEQGGLGCGDRGIDFRGTCFGHHADETPIHRRALLELPP